MIRELGFKRWIAWKLVQLAHILYDPEHYERFYITDPDGREAFSVTIVDDEYGAGVSSATFPLSVLPAGSTVHWDDDYRPEWLDDE